MRVDASLATGSSIADIADAARSAQQVGYQGLWTAETSGDPFLPLTIAAEHAPGLDVGTGIAVAFARTPMALAYTAFELQRFSRGRFILGLGSQVQAHIERRFSMPWSSPVERMREYIHALRAIWTAWSDGSPLSFEGEFYRHTLMTPFFTPPPMTFAAPRIFLAAVGARMTELTGEIADGLLVHPFTTVRYLEEHLLPTLRTGAEHAGRSVADLQLSFPCLIATGTDEQIQAGRDRVRERVAFYGSTPAYHRVLAAHGWQDLGEQLHALSRSTDAARWTRMASIVSDEVVDTFAVCGPPDRIGALLHERFAGLITRVSLARPPEVEDLVWRDVVASVANT